MNDKTIIEGLTALLKHKDEVIRGLEEDYDEAIKCNRILSDKNQKQFEQIKELKKVIDDQLNIFINKGLWSYK